MEIEIRKWIPKWAYYVCVVLFAGGMGQIFLGNLYWGVTLEENIFLIIVFACMPIVLLYKIKFKFG